MNKRTKSMLIGSGVTAAVMALAGSARHSAANYLVKVALDRKIPPHPIGMERRLAASCGDLEMLQKLQQAGAILKNLPHETVTLQSWDGTPLVGHWIPAKNPSRIIVAMHGWRSSWNRDFGIVADFFCKNNCSVLYAEQRGQGESGGQYMGFGLTERHDCLDWIQWANRRNPQGLPIYLCGVSMGASTVLMAADLPFPGNVRGIIADCGYTSAVDIWKHVVKQTHISYHFCGVPAGKMAKKRLQMNMDAVSCPQVLSHSHIPVLFVHGTDDRFVPIEMTYENYKACAAPKRLFVVPGAKHGMSYLVEPVGYEAAIKSFWAEFDKNLST